MTGLQAVICPMHLVALAPMRARDHHCPGLSNIYIAGPLACPLR